MIIGGHLLVIFLLRQVLVGRVVEKYPLVQQATRLFFLDYGLFIASGIGVCLFNTLVLGFPISSGLKIVVGFAALGLIPAFDLGLQWEYRIIRRASAGSNDPMVRQKYTPQTLKIAVLAGGTALFLTFSLLLILADDIASAMGQGISPASLSELLHSIVLEVVFVMGTFLGLTMLAGFSYARNLNLLFANQTMVLELVSQGHFATKVPVVTGDEFAVIAGHTNTMIDRLLERERMSVGLGLARQIQDNLLPKASPLLPGVQVFGLSSFCDETGGDFYDFLVREGETGPELVVMVGDVTGHGVGSALLMTSVRAYMRGHLHHIADLAEVMAATNAMLCRDVAGSGNFITVFLLSYTPSTRRANWVSAGHNPAIFQAFDGGYVIELPGQDIPLGVDPRWQYNLRSDVMPTGVLLLGTDGIWEATDSDNVMFGKERLLKVLEKSLQDSPQDITARIFSEIKDFTGAAEVDDDRTLVIARLA